MPNLVKGIHLEGLRVLGKPEEFAKYYYEGGADELFYVDVVASLYQRNSLHDIISRTAKEIFIPLTVGGGIRTIDDIRTVLRAGADKVSLNTAAINNPKFIQQAATIFGSSTIAISIEAIKEKDGKYLAYTDNGREYTGVEVIKWAKDVERLGAGEIILTSIDKEGTGEGFDINLVQKVASAVSIPVVASGGAGKLVDIVDVVKSGFASAVTVASMLHYYLVERRKVSQKFAEGNTAFIQSGKTMSLVDKVSIKEIKKYLFKTNISCRYRSE